MQTNEVIKYTQDNLQNGLKPYENKIKKLIKEEDFIKEIAFASMAIMNSDGLQKCTHESILQSVFNVATTGLSLNPILKYAALTPRYIKGKMQCVLSPMYQGLVKLITDTGSVNSVYAYIVYDGDEFEVNLGTDISIIHKPKFESKSLSKVYAVATLHDGSKIFEVMTKEDIEIIRGTSETWKAYELGKINANQCIWVTWFDEMARKSVIKRLVKYIPKTDRFNVIAEAINIDNADHIATDGQINYIESLIRTSTYDHDTQEMLIDKIASGISSDEASTMITDLQNNQLSALDTSYYNQGDIKNQINKFI